jgi:hypothetical protein
MPFCPGTGLIKGRPSLVVSNVPAQRNSIAVFAIGQSAASFLRQYTRFVRDQAVACLRFDKFVAILAADNDPPEELGPLTVRFLSWPALYGVLALSLDAV